jgi:hypothetical protein
MGLLGALSLGIGAFLPIVNVPILGPVSYWQVSYRAEGIPVEGPAIVVLALASFPAVVGRLYLFLWVTGFGGFCAILATFVRVRWSLAEVVRGSKPGLEREITEAVVQSMGFQFGWAVLAAGILLLLAAAVAGNKEGLP